MNPGKACDDSGLHYGSWCFPFMLIKQCEYFQGAKCSETVPPGLREWELHTPLRCPINRVYLGRNKKWVQKHHAPSNIYPTCHMLHVWNIYLHLAIFWVNVGNYSIHGASGYQTSCAKCNATSWVIKNNGPTLPAEASSSDSKLWLCSHAFLNCHWSWHGRSVYMIQVLNVHRTSYHYYFTLGIWVTRLWSAFPPSSAYTDPFSWRWRLSYHGPRLNSSWTTWKM